MITDKKIITKQSPLPRLSVGDKLQKIFMRFLHIDRLILDKGLRYICNFFLCILAEI